MRRILRIVPVSGSLPAAEPLAIDTTGAVCHARPLLTGRLRSRAPETPLQLAVYGPIRIGTSGYGLGHPPQMRRGEGFAQVTFIEIGQSGGQAARQPAALPDTPPPLALEITLLGTGAAERVPFPACVCPTCLEARRDPRFRRRYAKALVSWGETRLLIDCGRDLESSALPLIDGVLLTHFHFDHVLGLHRLGWSLDYPRRIPMIHPPAEALWGTRGLVPVMNGADRLRPHEAVAFRPLQIGEMRITPLPLNHGGPCFGYLLEAGDQRLAYLTDTYGLPASTSDFLMERRIDVAVVDCTFAPGIGRGDRHNDLDAALRSVQTVAPTTAVLTHISHRNWPYTALATYATALSGRCVVGLDGTRVSVREAAVAIDHPFEGCLEWLPSGLSSAPLAAASGA